MRKQSIVTKCLNWMLPGLIRIAENLISVSAFKIGVGDSTLTKWRKDFREP